MTAALEIATSEPYLAVLVGAPGSGKSHLAAATWADHAVLSSDRFRYMICGNGNDQSASNAAFWLIHWVTAERLGRRLTTAVDATNAEQADRFDLIRIARLAKVPAVAVVMDTPLAVCLSRNRDRPGPAEGQEHGEQVPDGWLTGTWAEIAQVQDATLTAEGFAEIIRVPWNGE